MKKILELGLAHHNWDSRIFYKQAVSLSNEFNIKCLWWVFSNKKWSWYENNISNIENIWISGNRLTVLFNSILFLFKNKSDIYVAHDIDSYLVLIIFKLFNWNSKIVFDSHEYYDEMYKIKNYSFIDRALYFIFSKIIKSFTIKLFSWVTVVTDDMKNYYSIQNKEIIYNFPLSDKLTLINDVYELKKIYKNKFILIYQWWVTKDRWIIEYLKIINKLINKIKNIYLLVLWPINSNDFKREIFGYIKHNKLENNVEILWKIPLFDVYKYTKIANIWLNFLQPSFNNDNWIQIKIFEYLYLDTPVLWTNNNDNFVSFIVKNNCWLAVNYWNIEESVNAIKNIYNNYDRYIENCKFNKEKFIWKNEEEKLLKFYKKIINEK